MRGKLGLRSFVLLGSILAISLVLMPVHGEARNIKVGLVDCYSGGATTFTYDGAGYRTLLTYHTGGKAIYDFDGGGKLTSLTNKKSDDSTVISSFDYTFDDADKITKAIHSNGDTVDYSYDVLNQLTKELKKNSSGSTLYTYNYFYDDVGNRTRMIKDSTTTNYLYDVANALTQSEVGTTTTTYSYDLNGNLT